MLGRIAIRSISLLILALSVACAVPPTPAAGPASTAATPGVETPKRGGQLVLGTFSFPPSPDAMPTTQRSAWLAMNYSCEGLFAADPQLTVQNSLVESWTYDANAPSYTFQLRKDVKFHDGSVLLAKDVVASLNRFAASPNGSTFSPLVDSIQAKDDQTVLLKLKQPSAAIPALLAPPVSAAYILSEASIANTPGNKPLASYVCTGPYQVLQFQPDQFIVMKRFEQYTARAGTKPYYVDEIKVVPVNVANVLNGVSTAAVDVVVTFPLDQYKTATANSDVQVLLAQYAQQYVLILNTKAGIMANPLLRKAVLAALAPEPILQADASDAQLYELNVSWFPPGSPWHSTAGSASYNHRDIAQAKNLLAQAGYKGEPFRFLDGQTSKTPVVIEQQLKEAGLNVQRVLCDNATFVQRRTQPEEWEAFATGGTNYTDPLTMTFVNASFPGWWDTPEKKAVLVQLTAEPDAAKRKAQWDQLQTLMWDQVPWVRHGSLAQITLASKRVRGLEATRITMPYLQNVWLAQ